MTWIPKNVSPVEHQSERRSLLKAWLAFAQRLDWSEPHHQDSELLAFSMLQKVMRSLSSDRKP